MLINNSIDKHNLQRFAVDLPLKLQYHTLINRGSLAGVSQKHTLLPTNVVTSLGVTPTGEAAGLLYRSKRRGHNKLGFAEALDGVNFRELEAPVLMLGGGKTEDVDTISGAHLTDVLEQRLLTYTRNSRLKIAVATEDIGIETWRVSKTGVPKAEAGVVVPEFKHNNQYVLYTSKNNISVALSKDLRRWAGPHQDPVALRPHNFDSKNMLIIAAQVINQGILVLYQSTKIRKKKQTLSIGAVLFDRGRPDRVLWRSEGPLWDIRSNKRDPVSLLGALIYQQDIVVYGTSRTGGLFMVNIPSPYALKETDEGKSLALARHDANPLISPEGGGPWEAVGTFNPAVLHDDGKVHILYRALDASGVSYVGYANTSDGVTIDSRHSEPAYWPRAEFEAGTGKVAHTSWSDKFGSGGGWGGCEDPKITRIGETIYLTYVAHSGWGEPRLAMSTISRDDFLNHRWKKWSHPRLISEPGVVNKSGIILPEKINGKYVVFHRVFPNINIHYTDDLENLGRSEWLEDHDNIPPRPNMWDSRKLSIGATPIRIDEGWLVIYHAVDDKDDTKYKIGAMILDADDPSNVIARTNSPILEPDMHYENDWKPGIAYPSGAAIINDTLHVYYGGGDKHVCVATAPLEPFVKNLLDHHEVKLENPTVIS